MKKQQLFLKSKDLNRIKSYNGVMIAQKYNFELTPEFIYFIEALKVEGYWSLKHRTISIQNKNLPFLKYIETILKNLKINVSKRILVKIKPFIDFNKKNTLISHNQRKLNFHIEKSPFDGSKKIVTSLPYKEKYNLQLKIKNKNFPIVIEKSEEEIEVKSNLKGWAYCDIKTSNINLLRFLSEFIGDNKKLKVEPFLINSDKEYVAAAFSALIDAEGSIDHYKLFRKIRIRMRAKNYLKEWQELLEKFNIQSRLSKNTDKEYGLTIEGWEDFDRLKRIGLNLRHSKKNKKFKEIFDSYIRNQISRNTAFQFYTQKLKEIDKPITTRELSKKLGKSKRVVNHYLTILMRKNLIKVNKSKSTYLYSNK